MIALFFLVAPLLLIASLAGYGAALRAVLGGRRQSRDFFEAGFWGLFLVTAAVLAANFFVGIGTAPGPYVLATGLVLFAVFQARGAFDLPPLVLLVTFAAAAAFLVRSGTALPFDAGLYYIPAMNWTAHQPAPLGLVNLEGRLGFDSAWLLFEAALRDGPVLGWSHLVVAEIALRSLAIGWMTQQLLSETAKGWTARSLFLLTGLVALSAYLLLRFASPSTTDLPANLMAFCVWATFAGLMLEEELDKGGAQFSLLVMLAVLAITFKLAMAPIILLPAALLLRRRGAGFLRGQGAMLCLVAVYGVLWLARNFLLSGCLAFPVEVTCFPVSWNGHVAGPMAVVVRGYARHPGIGMPNGDGLFDMAWLPSWFSGFGRSVEFWLVLAATVMALMIMAFPARGGRNNRVPGVSFLVWTSLVCAVIGLALWFVTAPNPRFSWCFFVMLGATLIFRALCGRDFAGWKGAVPPVATKKAVLCAVPLLLAVIAIQLYRGTGWILAPQPSFRRVAIPENWHVTMPLSGDQCWELFPCTPYGLGDVSATPWHGRLLFRANSGDRHS
jgi:hypothetical protein